MRARRIDSSIIDDRAAPFPPTVRLRGDHFHKPEPHCVMPRSVPDVMPGSALLITRGSEGMSLIFDRCDLPAAAKDVYDVTGAGDTVVAALPVGLGSGLELEQAVRLANAATRIVVGKVGTATVTRAELAAAT